MGWSYTRATCFDKHGNIDRREEMRKVLFGCTILKDRMVGSTYYAAIKNKNDDVFIFVALTSVEKWDFGYKDMEASMGPCVYTCPESILKLNTYHDGFTDEWIEKCRFVAERKKKLDKAKKIQVKMPFDTKYFREGETVNLYKNGRHWDVYGWSVRFTPQLMNQLLDYDVVEVIE